MTPSTASRLEYALLGLICKGVSSGYELRKQFASTPMGHFSDSPGSIYPALKRLTKRHWIALQKTNGANRRGKQVYGVTPAGQAALRAWMTRTVERDDIIWRLDELLLRFAFMGADVDRAAVIAFLEAFQRETAAYACTLRSFLQAMPASELPTGKLALASGLAQYETHARWAKRALREMRRLK